MYLPERENRINSFQTGEISKLEKNKLATNGVSQSTKKAVDVIKHMGT
jgi:hypothetical protein